MDFATITDNVNSIIKTAGVKGGNTGDYKNIPSVDAQREIIVSHMQSEYNDKTIRMLNAKAFGDTAKTYKNMLKSTEGEVQKLSSHASELETKVHTREADLKLSESRTAILQVLAGSVAITIAIYAMLGSSEYVHAIALMCLAIGFGYAMYIKGEPDAKVDDIVNRINDLLKSLYSKR